MTVAEKPKTIVERRVLYKDSEPLTIEFRENKETDIHSYTVLDPPEFAGKKQGVTGVTGFKHKEWIAQWAANMALEAKASGLPDSEAKYAHLKKRDKAGDIGTRVHNWIEAYFKGERLPIDIDMEASIRGFLSWVEENKPETLWSERIVYSKKYDYAGKLDWGGKLNGRYGLIDWKTGNCDEEYSSYYKRKTGKVRAKSDHLIQNAGYDIPIIEEDKKAAEFYGVLYIPTTGKVEYFETTETRKAQRAFVHTLHAKRGWKELEFTNKYREPSILS